VMFWPWPMAIYVREGSREEDKWGLNFEGMPTKRSIKLVRGSGAEAQSFGWIKLFHTTQSKCSKFSQ
jgi:hypothetical protein